jgi:hypothetical protein
MLLVGPSALVLGFGFPRNLRKVHLVSAFRSILAIAVVGDVGVIQNEQIAEVQLLEITNGVHDFHFQQNLDYSAQRLEYWVGGAL